MIDLTKGARRPHHHIRLTKEVKHDIAVWLTFLGQFNGRTFFLHEKWETSSSLQLYTDAAGSKGYGAIFGKHWRRVAGFMEILKYRIFRAVSDRYSATHLGALYGQQVCGILH